MRRIEAIIRHNLLERAVHELATIGIHGLTVFEVRGFGRQKGHTEAYRGTEYSINYVPKVMILLYVSEDYV